MDGLSLHYGVFKSTSFIKMDLREITIVKSTFEMALNMLKFNLHGSLNFKKTPLKLQRAIKSKNNNGRRLVLGGRRKGGH
jgi:hypothetical protein